jgi:hypothetical protein
MLVSLLLIAAGLVAFKLLYADRVSNLFVAHYDGSRVEDMHYARAAKFGGELELLGYDLENAPVEGAGGGALRARRGDTLSLVLYWRAVRELDRNLSTFAHLTTSEGAVVAQKDNLHPANLPTTQWEPDVYVADTHAFVVPAELAAGDYELRVGVYDPQTNMRLETSEGGRFLLLARVRVTE